MAKDSKKKVISKKHLARIDRERRQTRYILIASLAVIAVVIGLIGYGILDQTVLKPLKPVAKVGADNISTIEFQARVRYSRQSIINQMSQTVQFAQMFGSDPQTQQYFMSSIQQMASQMSDPTTLGQQVLDALIDERLIRQEAARKGITISSSELDKARQEFVGYYQNGTPTPTAPYPTKALGTLSPTQFAMVSPTPTITPTLTPTMVLTPTATPKFTATPTAVLTPTATATPYTLNAYQTNYKNLLSYLNTNIKFTEKDLSFTLESQLLRTKVENEVITDVVQDQDQVWARQIVVTDTVTAQNVLQRLQKGEDFGKIAKELSTDTQTKAKGGDMGWFSKDSQPAVISDVAFKLGIGQISQPIQSSDGYHILQIVGHEVRTISDSDYQTQRDNKFQIWLTNQRNKTNVVTYDLWKSVVPSDPAIPASIQQYLQGTTQ